MSRLAGLFLVAVSVAGAADPALLQLASPDARGLVGFSVRQAKSSPFGQFLLTQAGSAGKDYESFVATTGFDPRHNLDEILISSDAEPGAPTTRGLLVARGTFTPSKIAEVARSAGAEITVYNGVEIITPGSKNAGAMLGPSLAFFDSSLAVAGDMESVRGAIDRRQGGQSAGGPGANAKLAAKAGELSGAYDLWFVSLMPAQPPGPTQAPPKDPGEAIKSEVFKAVESASGGIKFGDMVKLAAELVARSEEDATNLASVLKFVTGIAMFQQGKQGLPPGIDTLLKSLDLKAQGKTVQIALSVPEQELERLIQQAKSSLAGAGGAKP